MVCRSFLFTFKEDQTTLEETLREGEFRINRDPDRVDDRVQPAEAVEVALLERTQLALRPNQINFGHPNIPSRA